MRNLVITDLRPTAAFLRSDRHSSSNEVMIAKNAKSIDPVPSSVSNALIYCDCSCRTQIRQMLSSLKIYSRQIAPAAETRRILTPRRRLIEEVAYGQRRVKVSGVCAKGEELAVPGHCFAWLAAITLWPGRCSLELAVAIGRMGDAVVKNRSAVSEGASAEGQLQSRLSVGTEGRAGSEALPCCRGRK